MADRCHPCPPVWETEIRPFVSRHFLWSRLCICPAGEKATDVMKHFLLAFSTLRVPKEVKMDNGPAYVSNKLQDFFSQWGTQHTTGIPHSPTGQSIIERTHQTLQRVLDQQCGGAEVNSPIVRLCKALFTINFLNNSFSEPTPSPRVPTLYQFHTGQIKGRVASAGQGSRELSNSGTLSPPGGGDTLVFPHQQV